MAKVIKTDELSQWHDCDVYTPARLIDLQGPIDADRAKGFIKNIRLLDFISNNDITVLLATEGGDVNYGLAIYDAIKECTSRVTIHIVGPCWSMGSIIVQAGDIRKMSQNATMMIHIGSTEYPEQHDMIQKQWIKENERLELKIQDILFEPIKGQKKHFTKKQLQNIIIFDKILPAKQALEYGLIDIIADHKEF